jgi:hypothetical protein
MNIRQKFIKNLYRFRLVFPEIRFNFFRFYPVGKKSNRRKKSVFRSGAYDDNIFFQKKKNILGNLPSVQKLIILKIFQTINYFYSDKNIIQYFCFSNFCFNSSLIKNSIFLNLVEKNFSKLCFQTIYSKNCYYQLFEIKDYNLFGFLDLIYESNYNTILNLIQKFDNFNLKLTHSFESYSINFNLFLFCECGSFFTPRISDKIFFRLHRFNFYEKRIPLSTNFREKKLNFKNKNLFKIIIESNFRVYAYKKKKTEIEVLQQFSETLYHLPNLFVGDLTVKSMNKALKNGISGENILSFLQNNLHPTCKKIPTNVSEQIKIWGLERKKNFICKMILASNKSNIWLQNFKRISNKNITLLKKKNFKALIFEKSIYSFKSLA